MNILQIVSSSRTSGAEKHVVVLSERLHQRGHNVLAMCPPGSWLPAQLRAAGVETLETPMHGWHSCPAGLRLARFVREQKIDLIHAHLTRATYLGLVAGRLAHLPLVSSVHCRTADLAYTSLFPKNQSRIITVSDFLRDGLLNKGVPAARVRTIYNGTEFISDDAPFVPDMVNPLPVHAELSLPPDAELIGLFARVDEFKGHPILVQAARRIVAARPRAYFVCVGTIDAPMQKMLWEMAARDGVADRLRFTGVRNDVHRLLSAMDVVTLPSRYEACSMSIIEAMALGKPVVATRAGGNPELVQEGETGLLIERTPDALADALIALLDSPARRQRMGEAARCRALTHFSANVMVDNIEGLYREIVG